MSVGERGTWSIVVCPGCAKRNRVPDVSTGSPACGSCHKPLSWQVNADDDSFSSVVDTQMAVLIDLWAPWCAPCRAVTPVLEETGRRHAGRLKTVTVNVDEAPGVAAPLGVQGIPTLVVWRDGHEVARQVGALPLAQLEQWVAQHIGNNNGEDR